MANITMRSTGYLCVLLLAEGEKPETKQKRLEAKYAPLQIVANIERLGTAKVSVLKQVKFLLFHLSFFFSFTKELPSEDVFFATVFHLYVTNNFILHRDYMYSTGMYVLCIQIFMQHVS